MSFDVTHAEAHVHALSRPRLVGSQGLREAREYVCQTLGSYGYEVRRQPFQASRLPIPLLTGVLIVCVLASLVLGNVWYSEHPGASLLVIAACLVVVLGLSRWPGWLERLFDLGWTVDGENLLALHGPDTGPTPRLLVMAHYDSKSETFSSFARVLGVTITGGGLGVLACLIALSLFEPRLAVPPHVVHTISVVLAVPAIAFAFQRTHNRSPGADDNASGVAVLLELARSLAQQPEQRAEILWVATDAEEIGLAGAVRLVQAFGSTWPADRVAVLNFDSVGTGPTVLLAGARHSPLKRLCRQRARDLGIRSRAMPPILAVGLDHMPLARRGYDAVTLLGSVTGPTSRRLHTARDVQPYVEADALQRCGCLAEDVIHTWLSRVGQPARSAEQAS